MRRITMTFAHRSPTPWRGPIDLPAPEACR
jgi:hypothetical protein